jgi:hypothetical protein
MEQHGNETLGGGDARPSRPLTTLGIKGAERLRDVQTTPPELPAGPADARARIPGGSAC